MNKIKKDSTQDVKSIKVFMLVLIIISIFNTIGLVYLINLNDINNKAIETILNQEYQAAGTSNFTDDYHTQSIIFNTDIEELIGHDLAHGVNDAIIDYANTTYGDSNNMYIITSSQEGDFVNVSIGKDNDTFVVRINPGEELVEILNE